MPSKKDIDTIEAVKLKTDNQLLEDYKKAIVSIALKPETIQTVQNEMANISDRYMAYLSKDFKLTPFTEFAYQQSKLMAEVYENFRIFMKSNLYGVLSAEVIQSAHKSWYSDIHNSLALKLQIDASLKTSIGSSVSQLAHVYKIFAESALLFTSIHSIRDAQISIVNSNIIDMFSAYKVLTSRINISIENIVNYPKELFVSTNREMYTSIGMIHDSKAMFGQQNRTNEYKSIGDYNSKDDILIFDVLDRVDLHLREILLGARQSLRSRNADKARQIFVSLRELIKNTVNKLAPDSCVCQWMASSMPESKNGRKSFKDKVSYITRNLPEDDYGSFARSDIHAKDGVLSLLSKFVHQPELHFNDDVLFSVIKSVESLLCYLITINDIV